MDDFDVDKFLRLESNAFSQDREVERILSLRHSEDPFLILGLGEDLYIKLKVTEKEIKMQFRKKSLLVHPDKAKHPKAFEAFEILKKAEQQCLNPARQEMIFRAIKDARDEVFYKRGIKIIETKERSMFSDEAPEEMDFDKIKRENPGLAEDIQKQFYLNLVDKLRRDTLRLKNGLGREIKMQDLLIKEAKIQREEKKKLEKTDDSGTKSWKKFEATGVKKKKKKEKPLGSLPF
ncbi:hypothetical protein EDD86DRAFT_198325 [Gorgonomyces haynaldii]|nr:hypothetical protein EDD86DRAFT_198325 [Gorgonomyces haynaldii]